MTYRGDGEVETLRESIDCLKAFRQRVTETSLLEPAQLDEIEAEAKALIDKAVADSVAAPPPTEADLLTDVYLKY